MMASFLVNRGHFSLLPDTWNLTQDNARHEFTRLRQKQAEGEKSFQPKNLELERQLAMAKVDAEIVLLEIGQNSSGCEVDENIRINGNLHARADALPLSEIIFKLELL